MTDQQRFCQMLEDFGIEYKRFGNHTTHGEQIRMTWDKAAGVGVKSIDWNFSEEGIFLWVE